MAPLSGGRSNFVWRVEGKETFVLKLFPGSQWNPLFANVPEREISALQSLAGTGVAPNFLTNGTFQGMTWITYSYVSGLAWTKDVGHVAQMLGRLHDLPTPQKFPAGCNGSASLDQNTRDILDACGGATVQILKDLMPTTCIEPLKQLFFVHGDPVPGNIVSNSGTLTIIDWQCPVRGDPCEDMAIFLSPAMQHLYRGSVLCDGEKAEFLAAYPNPNMVARYKTLAPWYHRRMAAYCLWKIEQNNLDYQEGFDLELAALNQLI
ncbi:MAG: phosphotransferase family protein [Paracoccaceae bacterium]